MVRGRKDMLDQFLEMLFPPKCICCGVLLGPGRKWQICEACFGVLPFTEDSVLHSGKNREGGCDCAVSLCVYTGSIKESLRRFKFFDKPGYYRTFAGMLSEKLSEAAELGVFDVIVGVPLYRKRENARGYNQAALLAGELSRQTGIPADPRLLSRVRDTGAQSLLPGNERENNVKGAFSVNRAADVKGKSVLLVDDVLTTGSTVDECSRVLKEPGAASVVAAVVAAGRKY